METTNNEQSELNMISIWGYKIPNEWLSPVEIRYLKGLPQELPDVGWVCEELDRVWNEQKLDNRRALSQQAIGTYYSHPVWLMNGLFSTCDSVSSSHRASIAKYLGITGVKLVADYGGGFGQLALSMAEIIPDAEIYIIEPYPSRVGMGRLRSEPRIKIVPNLSAGSYEAIVVQDVLEHVEDPISLAFEITNSTKVGGTVIFANCFFPVIQSHLPSTFHLRHTFLFVMRALGLRFVGTVSGAAHAQIFERVGELNLPRARKAEAVSRLIGPHLNQGLEFLMFLKSKIKQFLI